MKNTSDTLTFTVPLSWEAHSIAQRCRSDQGFTQNTKRIYLNTLAVYAVDYYLKCLGFKTNLKESESQNAITPYFNDVADLLIQSLGKLECRPVLPHEQLLQIPWEARMNRIGYLAVQLSQSLKQAEILGFTTTSAAQIPLTELRSLEELPMFLHQVQADKAVTPVSPLSPQTIVNLSQWLEGLCHSGWQALGTMLGEQQLVVVRAKGQQTDLQRAKLMDLGMQLGAEALAMVVTLAPEESETSVLVHLHPVGDACYLPAHLKLIMLSDIGEELQTVEARSQDNAIQLRPFSGQVGDRFGVRVELDDVSLTENFVF